MRAGVAKQESSGIPLRVKPSRPAEGRFISTGKHVRQTGPRRDLDRKRRFANLPGSRDHLNEPPWLLEVSQKLRRLPPDVLLCAHRDE